MTVQFSKIVKSLTLSRIFLGFFLLFSLQLFLRIPANGSFSRYLYSVRMRENADQNDSECGHFLRSINQSMVFKTRNSAEQLFLKILQNLQRKTCDMVHFQYSYTFAVWSFSNKRDSHLHFSKKFRKVSTWLLLGFERVIQQLLLKC